jgi:dTDP-4-dehydrorhamnose 3,5-epimerase
MKATPTALPEVLLLEPTVHGDARGFFMESWNARTFRDVAGVDAQFVQDNQSHSLQGVLRGIHYQVQRPQGKLVRVVAGAVFDVAVDLRRASPNFGAWVGVELSAENHRQLWIPAGFGHGFLVTSPSADVLYKTTEYWIADLDRCVAWNDARLAVRWPLSSAMPLLAERDALAPNLDCAELYP